MTDTATPKDLNERVQQSGELRDPKNGARPMNEAARRKQDATLRVYTVRELFERSLESVTSREPVNTCTTGIAMLDRKTGGIRPGFSWLIGADTNFGKSSYAIMLADINMAQGKRVCIVTAEDDPKLYGDRLLVRRAKVSAIRFRDRRLTPSEIQSVTDTVARALPEPYVIDGRRKSVETIEKLVGQAIKEHRIDLVFYDYLQEFYMQKPSQDRRFALQEINRKLSHVVTTAGGASVMLSQVTMPEGKKYPDKHCIRDCRDVTNASDVILIGFEPSAPINGKNGDPIADAGQKCILVDKAKDGTKGAVAMAWDVKSACFNEIEPEPGPFDEFDDIAEDGERYP